MTKKILYIHIGLPKCGSTTIQSYCRGRRNELESQGLFYPIPVQVGGSSPFFGHSDLSNHRLQLLGGCVDFEKNMKNRVQEIQASSADRAIISEEIFYMHRPEYFKALFDTFTVRLIVYLRSPALLEQSAILFETFSYMLYSTSPSGVSPLNASMGGPVLSRAYGAYHSLWTNWLSQLAPEQFILRDFDRASRHDLVGDFLSIFDIEPTQASAWEIQNESLKLPHLLFLAHSNLIPMRFERRGNLWRALVSLSRSDQSAQEYRTISDADLNNVDSKYISLFQRVGAMIGRSDFYESGLAQLRRRKEWPYPNLPKQQQLKIYLALPEDIRASLREALSRKPDEDSTFCLPDFPTTEVQQILDLWHFAHNKETKRQATEPPSDSSSPA